MIDISWTQTMIQQAAKSFENAGDMLNSPFVVHRAKMFADGNQWCALYGENIQDGVCGFGDTPQAAQNDFDNNWLRQTLPVVSKQAIGGSKFWVIERFLGGKSQGYWAGASSRSFTMNIDNAIQFRRRRDAVPIKTSWHWNDCEITEHAYLGAEDGGGE